MLATDVSAEAEFCLENWLNEAGTSVQNPTLTLYNEDVYDKIQEQIYNYNFNYLPYNWNIQYKYE